MSLKKQATSIFEKTLDVVKPSTALNGALSWDAGSKTLTAGDKSFRVDDEHPLYVIGTGKAAAEMARSVEEICGPAIADGMVITTPENLQKLKSIQVFRGSHPLPDRESLSSSYELRDFAASLPEGAVVLNLVSGGTSSLFCLPADPLEITDINSLYKLLVESGATIHEINTVRKVFSQVKGGQFLDSLRQTTLIDLVISDVPDDDLSAVGSGPTIAQSVSAEDAFRVLKKYYLYDSITHELRNFLGQQMDREVQGMNRSTNDFDNHHSLIISSARQMAEKCQSILESEGFTTDLPDEAWSGPVTEFEELIFDKITSAIKKQDKKPAALIFYGECTVQIKGDGLGGRNQELALRMAKRLQKLDREVVFLSAGTDGIDGPTDAAGAVVDPNTTSEAQKNGINADDYLERNDSYHFFDKAGGHIKPGGTGNNLMDLQIVLIPPADTE